MPFFMRGGRAFLIGPTDNLFGADSGNVADNPTGVTPATTRTIAEATRDAYGVANASWLADYDADPRLGIFIIYTDSGNTVLIGQVRVGGSWADAAYTVGIQGTPGSGTDFSGISDNHIPAIGTGPDKEPYDSGLRIDPTTNRFIADKGLEVPPGTIYIGEGTSLSAAVRAVHLKSSITGNSALILAQLYDETDGFSRAFVYSGDTIDTVTTNDPAGTDESDEAQFSITASDDELLTEITLNTTNLSETVDFEVTIRSGSHTGAVAFLLSGSFTTDSLGNATVSLRDDYNPLLLDSGSEWFVTICCVNMLGAQGASEFVPNLTLKRIVVTRPQVALRNETAYLGEVRMFDISRSSAVTKATLQSDGWAICDGTTPAAQGITDPIITTTPNLEHKFIRMSDDESSGGTGGEDTHTLTIGEIPPHTHTINCSTAAGTQDDARCGDVNGGTITSGATGGGDPHENKPPFYELVYFIKVKYPV